MPFVLVDEPPAELLVDVEELLEVAFASVPSVVCPEDGVATCGGPNSSDAPNTATTATAATPMATPCPEFNSGHEASRLLIILMSRTPLRTTVALARSRAFTDGGLVFNCKAYPARLLFAVPEGLRPFDSISIRPYSSGDRWVLERTLGEPSQMVHLNGPESPEQIQKRHEIFLDMSANQRSGCMYTILVGGSAAGSVGYWETDWEGEKAWETGWFVLPEFQSRGIATEAVRLMIQDMGRLSGHRYLLAFPSVSNAPSNAIARKLGFELAKEIDVEYPAKSGKFLRSNVWRLKLEAP